MSSLQTHRGAVLRPACCEALELRRLLAASFDSSFGGGDGWLHLPLPFFAEGQHELGATTNIVVPTDIGQVQDRYLVSLWHAETVPFGTPGTLLMQETIQTLLEDDGQVSGDFAADADGDGLAFRLWSENQAVANYRNSLLLPGGRLLVTVGADLDHPLRGVAEVRADGAADPDFGVDGIAGPMAQLDDNIAAVLDINRIDPVGPSDPDNQGLELQLFNTDTGELLGAPVRPFGDWLTLADFNGAPEARALFAGPDNTIYVGQSVRALGNPELVHGLVLSRLTFDGSTLAVDESFGNVSSVRTTPSIYIEGFLHSVPQLAGVTPTGRAWVQMPILDDGGTLLANERRFALLENNGDFDMAFGEDGVVTIRLADSSQYRLSGDAEGTPGFGAGPTAFVRPDGSLLGVASFLEDGGDLPENLFGIAVFGLRTDGAFDDRIAGADSPEGLGRVVLTAPAQPRPGTGIPIQSIVRLDRQGRLLITNIFDTFEEVSPDVHKDIIIARIALGSEISSSFDSVTGRLRIDGSDAADAITLRLAQGMIQLFSGDQFIEEHPATDVTFVDVHGAGGDDELTNQLGSDFSGFVTLLGGSGNDILSGNGRYDRLFGEDGDDSLVGSDGDQLLFGGAGADTLFGADGRDALWGGEGNDQLNGSIGNDFMDGGAGDDLLTGQAGDDTLVGGAGNDSLNGDAGIDLLSYFERTDPISASLTSRVGGAEGESDAFDNELENMLGGSGADLLTGDTGRNRLFGAGGNDTLLGMDGKDQLLGGGGSDRLDGGDDADWLIDLGDGTDILLGGGGFDVGLSDSDDEDEQTERVTRTIEEFLGAI